MDSVTLQELYANAVDEVRGPVRFAHQWVNMTDVTVQINATHTVSERRPADRCRF